MILGFPNPLQKAEEVRKVSSGAESVFRVPVSQLMFREFQTISIQIDAQARGRSHSFYHLWSLDILRKHNVAHHIKKLIISQLEQRGYTVTTYDDKIYIQW